MAKKKTALQTRLRLVKVPTVVYLEPEQAEAIRSLSESTGKPMQSYMREGIAHILEKHEWVREAVPGTNRRRHTLVPRKGK